MESPFEVLLIDSDADDGEINRAYRRRVLETHPDQGGSREEFQRVKAAYEALKNGHQLEEWEADLRPEPVETENEPEGVRVEYLNYDDIDDHGWSLDDEDLFEKASDAGLDPADHGHFFAQPNDSLLEAAEEQGLIWPYACRGGACANCAVAVVEGEMEMPAGHILSSEMLDHGFRLSCICAPTSEELKVIYNVKHLPDLDDLRLPASRFERAHLND